MRASIGLRILDTRFTPEWLAAHPSDRALVDLMAARADAVRTADQLRGEREQLTARRHHDVSQRLSVITCPTFIACGRYDGIAPLPNSEWIATQVRRAALRVYEGGHVFFLQDPAALRDIAEFLAGGASVRS